METAPKSGRATVILAAVLIAIVVGAFLYKSVSVRIAATNASVHFARAQEHHRGGHLDLAIREYREALAANPSDGWSYYNIGLILIEQRRDEEAQQVLEQATRLMPENADAHVAVGLVLFRANLLSRALDHFVAATRVAPRHALAHYDVGVVRRAQGDLDGAVAAYRAAIDIDGSYADARFNLGHIYLHDQGRAAEAAAEFSGVIELQPRRASAHWELGLALERLGRRKDARDRWRSVVALDPAFEPARARLRQGTE